MRPAAYGLGAGAVVAGVCLVTRALVGGLIAQAPTADQTAELRGWLAWQLWDNVAAGRSPGDASVFVEPVGALWELVGNPGAAVFVAPLHAGLSPGAAALLAHSAALALNVLAGGLYGSRHRAPWLGALGAAAAWWALRLGSGGAAQGLIAPALVAAWAWQGGHRAGAGFAAALGALVAPAPTLGGLIGAGAWPLGLLPALGLLAPPLGSEAGPATHPGDLFWPAGAAGVALPLGGWLALAAVWRAGGAARWVGAAALAAILATVAPAEVGGFRVALPHASAAWVGFGLAAALAAALPVAGRSLRRSTALAVGALLWADALGPIFQGGGVWPERPRPAPEGLAELAAHPRRAEVVVLPEADSPAAGVGWIPTHRQHAWAPPRRAQAAQAPPSPAALADHVRRSTRPVVLVWVDADGAEASALASALGPPASYADGLAVWR